MSDHKPLTAEELDEIFSRPAPTFSNDLFRLRSTIDALRAQVEGLTAERDAARQLAIDALNPPVGNGWSEDRFEAAKMMHAQRQSWARQERD
jgi:hypothetical protein